MDFVEINRFTQEKKVNHSRDLLYSGKINDVDALRLITYAIKKMYGIKNASLIIHKLGVKEINLREEK